MPTPKKPRALKILQGTDQPVRRRRAPKFDVVESADPPDVLIDPVAVALWKELAPQLIAVKVLKRPQLTGLAVMCNLWAKMVQKWRLGGEPSAADVSQFRMYLGEYALTPASETKAPGDTNGADENPFRALEKKA